MSWVPPVVLLNVNTFCMTASAYVSPPSGGRLGRGLNDPLDETPRVSVAGSALAVPEAVNGIPGFHDAFADSELEMAPGVSLAGLDVKSTVGALAFTWVRPEMESYSVLLIP